MFVVHVGRVARCAFQAVFIVSTLGVTPAALAANFDRVAPGGGSFFNTGLWSPTGVPGSGDRAIFNLSSGYTVTFTRFPLPPRILVNDRLRIGDDNVTFDLDGLTYSLASTSSTSLSVGGNAILFGNEAAYGSLWITDGTLNAQSVTVGDGSDIGLGTQGSGALRVRSGGLLNSDGVLTVGGRTTGEFIIENGGDANGFLATIGGDAIGTASVHGAGSTWTTDSVDVGTSAYGRLTIGAGAIMDTTSSTESYVGVAPGVTGQVTVAGAGSRWDSEGPFIIGHSGIGDLYVSSGAVVQSSAFNTMTVLGNQSGSSGVALIRDAGTRWADANVNHKLVVGNQGQGSLTVMAGAEVSFDMASIGAHPSGSGAVEVKDAGSLWNSPFGVFVGGSQFTDGGTGTLTIGPGATATANPASATKVWSPGTINLNGGTLQTGRLELLGGAFNWTTGTLHLTGSGLDVEPGGLLGPMLSLNPGQHVRAIDISVGLTGAGTLTGAAGTSIGADFGLVVGGSAQGTLQTSGTLTSNRLVTIGDEAGVTGTVTIENGGSWDHTSDLGNPLDYLIGDAGIGTINVLSGSVVEIRQQVVPTLGNQTLGQGTINIDGVGSEVFIELHDLSVGRFGEGTVNITGGGRLVAPNSAVFIGEQSAANGQVALQDAGSIMTAAFIVVGGFTTGSLTIEDGAAVAASEVFVAAGDGSNGMVEVDGTGSRLSALSGFGNLIIGGANIGSLTVTNGGVAEAKNVILGDGTNATGEALVSGAGSQLTATDEILIGFMGSGTLTVADGGLAAAPIIVINAQSTLRGDGTAMGEVVNYGDVAPGLSAGVLSIDGDFIQPPEGALQIELGGTMPGSSYDVLAITGAATLDGVLEVLLIDGFAPTAGDAFEILTAAGGITDVFTTQLLPALTAGLDWSVSYDANSVLLEVAAAALTGDYNRNGVVDAADYTVWRDTLGSTTNLAADGNGNSVIDAVDYGVWKRNFGDTSGAGSSAAVPEPAAAVLVAIGLLAAAGSTRKRRWPTFGRPPTADRR